jgi:hypothetical protein
MDGTSATYGVPIRLGSLATAEVAQRPGCIAKHAKLAAVTKQSQQGLERTAAEDIVAALGAIASDITERPDRLFTNVRLRALQELNEDRHGTSLDDDLSLGRTARSNVGQGPSSLELDQSMWGSEKFNESANNTGLDDLLDGGIALLGKQLSELRRSLNLEVDLIGEDACDHLREVLVELHGVS